MGINSRVDKSDIFHGAVDILFYFKYCLDNKYSDKAKMILDLRGQCVINYYWSSQNRDEKLADLISEFELKYRKVEEKDFNSLFEKIFPRTGLNKVRLSSDNYYKLKKLVWYVLNRNMEWRSNVNLFAQYKACSEDTKKQIEELFASSMDKYQERVEKKDNIHNAIYGDSSIEEDEERESLKAIPESLEIFEIELEKKYLDTKLLKEQTLDRNLSSQEILETKNSVVNDFIGQNQGYDETEIWEIVQLFYERTRNHN